jgi:hypothetical protein
MFDTNRIHKNLEKSQELASVSYGYKDKTKKPQV